MDWKTQNGRRPDLEALEVNAPMNWIGDRIYPNEQKAESSGTLWYAPVQSEVSAQSGRDPQTGAITRTFVATAQKPFACEEKISRYSLTADDVGNLGGIAKADLIGGRGAHLAIKQKLEAIKALALMTGDAHAVDANIFTTFRTGLKAIKRFSGRNALVCSLEVYNTIVQSKAFYQRLTFSGVTLQGREDVLSLKPEVLRQMLQQFFGVEEILVGDDDIWNASAYAGKAVLVKLPSVEEMSYKSAAELGKTICYMLDNNRDFVIESHPNENDRIDDYDAVSYVHVVEFNAGAKYIISGIVEGFDATYSVDGSGVAFEYLGAYSAAATYSINDMVTSGGSLYVSLVNGNTAHTPASGSAYWGVAAAAGVSTYTYVAYASDATGTGFSLTPTALLKYRAEIQVHEDIAVPDAADFSGAAWVKYIGDDGV